MHKVVGTLAAAVLNPVVRFVCLRSEWARPYLWTRLIAPKLRWRDYRFQAKSTFNCKFTGTTSDIIQSSIYYFGIWEPFVGGFIAKRLATGDVVIDIGANIGYVSLLAASIVGPSGRVVSIEASNSIFKQLNANVALNSATQIRTICGAVSDTEGELELSYGPAENSGATSLVRNFGGATEIVHAAPLAHWLTAQEISEARLIKIDVEGAEMKVLNSILPLLPRMRSDLEIVCEVSPDECKDSFEPTMAEFAKFGFHVYSLPHDNIEAYLRPSAVRPVALPLKNFPDRRTEIVVSRRRENAL